MTHFSMAFLLALAIQGAPPNPPRQPQQQQQAQPQRRTGTIEGVVLNAVTKEPLAGAQVLVLRVPAPAAPGAPATANPAPMPPIFTENDGKFVTKDLPAGVYRVNAGHNGYARLENGQRSPRLSGTPITVQAGQSVKDIVFRLTPAGSMTGHVKDSKGQPVAGIVVQLLRPVYTQVGKRMLATIASVRTNDLGEYRLYWITPGTYYVSASPATTYIRNFLQGQPNAAPTGTNASAAADSTAAVLESLLGANRNEVLQPDFVTTYHPNTTDHLKAAPVDVKAGSDLRGPEITLAQQEAFTVRGRVLDSRTRTQPLSATVQMARKEHMGTAPVRNANYDRASGTFEFRDVAPGEYYIVAVTQFYPGSTGIAEVTTKVSNNVENLVLTVRNGSTVRGQIKTEGTRSLTPQEFAGMRAILVSAALTANVTAPSSIKADGSFAFDNVFPGEYRVAIQNLPGNSYIKEARLGETNLLEKSAAIDTSTLISFELVASRNGGQVSGRVLDQDSKPVGSMQVVLAPDQQREWRELLRTRVTDQTGKFTFQGIPPGDYKLFAWEDIDPLAFTDPEILRQYEGQAKAVKIAEMSQETADIKVIPAQQ